MSSPGAIPVNAELPSQNVAASRIPERQSSIRHSAPRKHNSLTNKSAPPDPQVGRQGTVVVRKKLPWLDGSRIPGQFDSKDSLGLGKTDDAPDVSKGKNEGNTEKKPSVASVGGDPALRAVGSTPSLRQGTGRRQFKSLSLSSQPRPGIPPVASKGDAKRALGMNGEGTRATEYASSMYSVTPLSDKDEFPPSLPLRQVSSYQKLVDKRSGVRDQVNRNPFVSEEWLQDQINLQTESPVSPKHPLPPPVRLPTGLVSPRQQEPPGAYQRQRRSDSCRSCGADIPFPEPLRTMPKAKTLPRRSTAALPAKPQEQPPPPPPTRKATLYAMPNHLLPSSSSSSQGYLRKAPEQPVPPPQHAPPPPPPRAATSHTMRRESQSLNRAVTGLENLMEEALNVARDAAKHGRNDEVANILDNATLALRRASTAAPSRWNEGRMSQPLVLSPPISQHISDDDSSPAASSDASSGHSRGHSIETAPTLLTKSAQPSQQLSLAERRKASAQFPRSLKPSVESFDTSTSAQRISPDHHSISRTPPRLYQPPSADSIVRDFAYARAKTAQAEAARKFSRSFGMAADYYGDKGQSVQAQPGVRPSISAPMITDKPLPGLPGSGTQRPPMHPNSHLGLPKRLKEKTPLQHLEPAPTQSIPPRISSRGWDNPPAVETAPRQRRPRQQHRPHLSDLFESAYYHQSPKPAVTSTDEKPRVVSSMTESRYVHSHPQSTHSHTSEHF